VDLAGRTVLITGATGGLGQAIAGAFADRGASLTLTGRRAGVLEQLAPRWNARTIACDLALPAEVERLAAQAGEVDVLIANAGLPATGRLEELTQRQIDAMLDVNLRAPIALARALLPGMLSRRRGHIVFMSSLSGKAASPLSSLYNATKFGLRGFALSLREDTRGDNVGVSVVLPGFISDAGLFADAGVRLPPWIGTRTPADVAAATVRAVEHNRPEVSVAPGFLKLGADVASVAPGLAATVARLTGGDRLARAFSAGQLDKRPAR
jgi:short-subunit dehydrogenase